MRKTRIAVLATAALITAASVAGCNSTNHDTLNPSVDIAVQWWRVETPPGAATLYFACFGTEEIWVDPEGNITTTPDSPMCPKGGAPYTLETRHGSDPAVIVGTYRLVPPDSTGKYQAINGRP